MSIFAIFRHFDNCAENRSLRNLLKFIFFTDKPKLVQLGLKLEQTGQ